MKYVIEHPKHNATKTVTVTPVSLPKGDKGYRVEIVHENYSDGSTMYSKRTVFSELLYEEELEGLITALQRIKMAKLLGLK